jgi:hypothetical protein
MFELRVRWRLFKSDWFPWRAVTLTGGPDEVERVLLGPAEPDWRWHPPRKGPLRWWMLRGA